MERGVTTNENENISHKNQRRSGGLSLSLQSLQIKVRQQNNITPPSAPPL
jgi:hypothetical protein